MFEMHWPSIPNASVHSRSFQQYDRSIFRPVCWFHFNILQAKSGLTKRVFIADRS